MVSRSVVIWWCLSGSIWVSIAAGIRPSLTSGFRGGFALSALRLCCGGLVAQKITRTTSRIGSVLRSSQRFLRRQSGQATSPPPRRVALSLSQ